MNLLFLLLSLIYSSNASTAICSISANEYEDYFLMYNGYASSEVGTFNDIITEINSLVEVGACSVTPSLNCRIKKIDDKNYYITINNEILPVIVSSSTASIMIKELKDADLCK